MKTQSGVLFLPDPLEWQLIWLDDSNKLLSEAKQPFLPPKLACLSDLNLYSSQLQDPLMAV